MNFLFLHILQIPSQQVCHLYTQEHFFPSRKSPPFLLLFLKEMNNICQNVYLHTVSQPLPPFFFFISSISCSKYFLPTSMTTSEYIWIKRR